MEIRGCQYTEASWLNCRPMVRNQFHRNIKCLTLHVALSTQALCTNSPGARGYGGEMWGIYTSVLQQAVIADQHRQVDDDQLQAISQKASLQMDTKYQHQIPTLGAPFLLDFAQRPVLHNTGTTRPLQASHSPHFKRVPRTQLVGRMQIEPRIVCKEEAH